MTAAQSDGSDTTALQAAASNLARFAGLLEVMQSPVSVPKAALASEIQELFLLCYRDFATSAGLNAKLHALEAKIGDIFRS